MGEPEDKGYTVEDRRYLHLSEEEKAKVRAGAAKRTTKDAAAEEAFQEAAQKATAAAGQPEERGALLPEITFASLLVSLSSTAFVGLGAVPDPESGKTEKNLPLAKQTIDLLGLLREKTRNNLTLEEENLFDHLLYDLRMAYVREVG
jgi:ribosomal protein S12 methylthiotransferase accessory factor YcaO